MFSLKMSRSVVSGGSADGFTNIRRDFGDISDSTKRRLKTARFASRCISRHNPSNLPNRSSLRPSKYLPGGKNSPRVAVLRDPADLDNSWQ